MFQIIIIHFCVNFQSFCTAHLKNVDYNLMDHDGLYFANMYLGKF